MLSMPQSLLENTPKRFSYIWCFQRYFFEINVKLVLQERRFILSVCIRAYTRSACFSYFKLLCKDTRSSSKSGRNHRFFFWLSVERTSFFASLLFARYTLHFSLALPFLPHSTRVDVPVFLLLLAVSFCLPLLLPADYASVVDMHEDRLSRFVSLSSLFLFLSPFLFCNRMEANIYAIVTPTILRLCLSLFARVSLLLVFFPSFFYSLWPDTCSLFPIRSPSFFVLHEQSFVLRLSSFRVLLLFIYRVSQKIQHLS